MTLDYIRNGEKIYQESFAIIARETDLSEVPEAARDIVIRMIHACGMVDLISDIKITDDFANIARAAIENKSPILCDSEMVAKGITKRFLPHNNKILCKVGSAETAELAVKKGNTRSATAFDILAPVLDGAIVAIGNAPTALFRLIEMINQHGIKPAAIIATPVGFVGAAESKLLLTQSDLNIPYVTVLGRRGGSAIAAAAINAIALL